MLGYILKRVFYMIPTLFVISAISFMVIELPPGDFVTSYVAQLESSGGYVSEAQVESLRDRFGVDKPIYVKYAKWLKGLLKGELGRSLQFDQPAMDLIKQRFPVSLGIAMLCLIFVYIVGIPIGIYSAVNRYTIGDYIVTFLGFLGVGIPSFLSALIFIFLYYQITGQAQLGLFSSEFIDAPFSIAKLFDLVKHLWLPIIIISAQPLASTIRQMRANLLDELEKPYVMVARSKGLNNRKLLYKYPVRLAINPIVSTVGWTLPNLINNMLLACMVLGIPSIAPILLDALLSQDMYLAGSIIFFISVLTVVGTLVSDLLLAIVDPRIRLSE
jgi:peptide/nickel transport system permease protein